jgi:two-component system, LytTR family, response regulator
MTPIRVMICDDEPLARSYLRGLIESEPECEIVSECKDADEAITAIESLSPDLVFLDIQMPGQSGLEVIEEIGHEHMPYTVFVTAHDRYAIPAFERQALDYLLKPFTEERFRKAMQRVRAQVSLRRDAQWAAKLRDVLVETSAQVSPTASGQMDSAEIIPVKVGGRTVLVRTVEVEWIEAADCYVNLRKGKDQYLHREAMQSLESRLNPRRFIRVHRGVIINVNFARELRMEPNGTTSVIMKDGTTLPLSRRRKKEVERLLGAV